MGRKPMTAEQRERMRTRILDAARDTFLQSGIEGLSMRGIASRVGVSSMTLYLYYESRQDIVRHIVLEGFRMLNEQLEKAALLGSMEDKIRKVVRTYLNFAADQSAYYAATYPHAGEPAEDLDAQALDSAVSGAVTLVQRILEDGGLPASNAHGLAYELWAHLHGWSMLCVGGQVEGTAVDSGQISQSYLDRLNRH